MRMARLAGVHGLWIVVVLALATATGAQQSPMNPMSSSRTIVPGYAIGPWTLDMSWTDLIWNLGVRSVALSNTAPAGAGNRAGFQFRPNVEVDVWADRSIVAVHAPGDNDIQALGIGTRDYLTRDHVGVGASQDQITTAYGAAPAVVQSTSRPKVLLYNNLGLAFQMSFDPATGAYGPVEAVYVFRPGLAGNIWRVP
jgi:hypothetical protein